MSRFYPHTVWGKISWHAVDQQTWPLSLCLTFSSASSSGMASGECLLISLLQATQKLALSMWGWKDGQRLSPERWIWLRRSLFVTGMVTRSHPFYVSSSFCICGREVYGSRYGLRNKTFANRLRTQQLRYNFRALFALLFFSPRLIKIDCEFIVRETNSS